MFKLFKGISNASSSQPLTQGNGVSCSIDELIALKMQAEKLQFPLKHKSRSHVSGGKRSSLRGRGLDFDEVRAYQAGDEIRAIDWKVTARTGEVHTKVYKEEKEKPVFVLLDLRKPMFFGSKRYFKSVSACHLASLLAWSSVKHGDRFGGIIFSESKSEEIKPKASNKAALNFIHIASEMSEAYFLDSTTKDENKLDSSLNFAIDKLHQIVRPGSLIYLISDFHDFSEECKQKLSLISRHNDIIALNVSDPLERALPDAKRLLFTNEDAQEQAITELHGNQKKTRQDYETFFEEKNSSLEQQLLDCRIPTIFISSADEAYEQLQLRNLKLAR